MPIVNTKHDIHLGNFISCDIYDRNIDNTVCDVYQRGYGLINEFRACDCIPLNYLHKSYCMHMYGCELWYMNDKKSEAFRITWRKIKRRIWKLPTRAHNTIVHNLSYNFDVCLDMKIIKFVYNALNHSNEICHNLLHTKLNCMRSTFSENYQYLSYKYQLSDRDWYNDLEYLLGKVQIKFSNLFEVHQQLVMWLNYFQFEITLSFVIP